jgi:hypothetical protein
MTYALDVRVTLGILLLSLLFSATSLQAQDPQAAAEPAATPNPWMFMYDGVFVGIYNNQGGPRGGDELVATNWIMGMAGRSAGPGQLTLTGMFSLEPATVGSGGYRELFQVGESYHFLPLVDHQHPHDLAMQASVAWRLPLDERTHLTFAGAPVGEPALGPTAFMHRRSAAENPTAPLGHHTFDSTHIAMGVITAAVDRGPWTVEGSIFQSTEPDENRWDIVDLGALDSWSARVWYEPSSAWQIQVSHGYLGHPERLEFQSVHRTTGSVSWLRSGGRGYTAVTAMLGHNQKSLDGGFTAALVEATHRERALSVYGRAETLQVETLVLQTRTAFHSHSMPTPKDVVTAATAGLVGDLPSWRGVEMGVGADVTAYVVPGALQPYYGNHPLSAHVFVRVRPPVGHMGRMWNMRMARPLHQ